jgi:hypothetical protein
MAFDYQKIQAIKEAAQKQANRLSLLKAFTKVKPTIPAAPSVTAAPVQNPNTNSGGLLGFVKNTFKPGPAVLKKELANTARVYAYTPYRNSFTGDLNGPSLGRRIYAGPRAVSDRIADADELIISGPNYSGAREQLQNNAVKGFFARFPNNRSIAVSSEVMGGRRPTMRHELTHASQSNPVLSNSMSGLIKKLESSEGPWRKSLSRFLSEVHANAAMSKTIPGKIYQGTSFALNPERALVYSLSPGYGGLRYAAIHGGLAAPGVAAGGYGLSQAYNSIFKSKNNHLDEQQASR